MNIFRKQPGETLDYDVEFEDWIPSGDNIVSEVTTVEPGLTKVSTAINVVLHSVKVMVSGGTDGVTYRITTRITTALGRVKEQDFRIKVKEIS